MENFDEYIRQGEPNKSEKAKVWKTAIGLQQVNIHATNEFLLRFFGNLLLGENHVLINREIHVHFTDTVKEQVDTVKPRIDTVNDTVFSLIKQHNNIKATEISERLSVRNGKTITYAI